MATGKWRKPSACFNVYSLGVDKAKLYFEFLLHCLFLPSSDSVPVPQRARARADGTRGSFKLVGSAKNCRLLCLSPFAQRASVGLRCGVVWWTSAERKFQTVTREDPPWLGVSG